MMKLSNLTLRSKLLLLILAPIAGLLYFAGSDILGSYRSYSDARKLEVTADLVVLLNETVHTAQLERGTSCGFLGGGGVHYAEALKTERQKMDLNKKQLHARFSEFKHRDAYPEYQEIARKLHTKMDELDFMRAQIDALSLSCSESLEWYGALNNLMILSINGLMGDSHDARIAHALQALDLFLHLKEMVGMERGLVNGVLEQGSFSTTTYKRLVEIVANQEYVSHDLTLKLEEDIARAYQQMVKQSAFQAPLSMRQEILNLKIGEPIQLISTEWFSSMSEKVELMHRFNAALMDQVMRTASLVVSESITVLRVTLVVILFALGLILWVAYQLMREIVFSVESVEALSHDLQLQTGELSSVLASMGDGLVVVDPHGIITRVNSALSKMSGVAEERLLNNHFEILFSDLKSDGSLLHDLSSLSASRLQQIHDQDHEAFHQILASAPLPLLVVNIEDEQGGGTVFIASDAFLAQSGHGADAVVGQPVADLLAKSMARSLQRWLLEVSIEGEGAENRHHCSWNTASGELLESTISLERIFCGEAVHVLIQIETAQNMAWRAVKETPYGRLFDEKSAHIQVDKELIVEGGDPISVKVSSSVLFHDDVVGGAVLAIHDLSSYWSAENERHANEAKDEFLASMSHELRTPLSAIIGNGEILSESALNQDQLDLLNAMTRSGQHLLSLVNDILDLSKIESGKFEIDPAPYDLAELVSQLEEMFTLQARDKGIGLAVELDEHPKYQLWGDQKRIGQVLLNLLGNAFKFTEEGTVLLRCWREGEQLNFEVADTGIGMSAEVLERLFKPFEQADSSISRRFGGTGLGLHISAALAGVMSGRIDVSSEEGRGSRFLFTLPYSESDLFAVDFQKIEKAPVDGFSDQLFTGSVLIAEDTPELQLLESRILKSMGATVTLVNDGQEAVSSALEQQFDLILMDMQMPNMNGLEATKTLRDLGNETPIVALTANVMQKHKDQFYAAGAEGFLHKPIDKRELRGVLMEHLQQGGSEPQSSVVDTGVERVSSETGVSREAEGTELLTPILAMDDEQSVLDLYYSIFGEKSATDARVQSLEASLGIATEESPQEFMLTLADQGEEGVMMAELALDQGNPYQIALIDMRMPPGIDGLETAKALRALDKRIFIVIVTAYSDTSPKEISRELGYGVLYLNKPFDRNEVEQIARMLSQVWRSLNAPGGATAVAGEAPALEAENVQAAATSEPMDELIDDELKQLFAERTRVLSAEFIDAVEQRNWREARQAAHTIAGSGTSFGYPKLTQMGKAVCKLIDEGDEDQSLQASNQFIEELKRIG